MPYRASGTPRDVELARDEVNLTIEGPMNVLMRRLDCPFSGGLAQIREHNIDNRSTALIGIGTVATPEDGFGT